jgi:hypothetical protein
MSNYPNMSYCQCENTLLALRQVLNSMQEEGPMFLQEMNKDERRAYEQLFHACEAFLTISEELEDAAEDYDGQPDEQQEWHDFDPDC